jgi:hypothetical protein
MIELSNTADISRENLLFNALVVGFKGVGKTTLCAGFPDPLVVDFDGGMASMIGASVPFIPPTKISYESLLELTLAVQKRTPEGKITLKSKDGSLEMPCSTIVLDSITRGHRMFLQSAMALGKRTIPAIQDWGLAADRILQFIDGIKPYVHVLVVAHFEIVQDKNTERVMAQIRMPGQLVDLLPIACDEFWHVRSEVTMERKRKVTLWTINDGIFPGATRHGRRGMPPVLDITDDGTGKVNPYNLIRESIRWPNVSA